MDTFITEAVNAHNTCRQQHGAAPVKHNPELSLLAQKWSDHLASKNKVQHSNHTYNSSQLGENCASRWSSAPGGADYTGEEVVTHWYKEVEKHDFLRNDYNPGTCHFSQVVWKASQEIGLGKTRTSDGRVYVVCNYYPPGNVMGHFQENIGRPHGGRPAVEADTSGKAAPQPRQGSSVRRTSGSDMMSIQNAFQFSVRIDSFVLDVLSAHNVLRYKHGAPPIKHNQELTKIAQKWADHLASAKLLQHSNNRYKSQPLGENCASRWCTSGADYTGEEVVEQWYKEVAKHDFIKNDYNPGTCHFSQVVWNDSKELGVGKAKTKDGRCVVVCNYFPAGNVAGQFKQNIGKLKK